jgi:hypothetical protein
LVVVVLFLGMNEKMPIDIIPGAIISSADTYPKKWFRTYYRVSDDGQKVQPLVRAHYWCSTAGKVVDVSNEPPREITYGENWVGNWKHTFSPKMDIRPENTLPEVTA